MNETKKPLEFKEWWEADGMCPKSRAVEIWAAARLNMIPADRAVEIPEEAGEWEPNDKGYALYGVRTEHTKKIQESIKTILLEDGVNIHFTAYIPRPQPQWTPRVGEAVFAVINEKTECRFSVARYEGNGIVTWPNGRRSQPGEVDNMKPFSESAIGKEWSAI